MHFLEGPQAVPEYIELPPVLVVYGAHCRISNIVGPPGNRRWKEDEEFWISGLHVAHKMGQPVKKGTMENWLLVRDEHPELFEEIVVFQQPSATFDEVLIAWDLQDLAKRFPAVVLQRDLLSGALTIRSKMAAQLLHILMCWVGPGMTPVVQLTDTDFSYILKRYLEFYKLEVARMKKEKATREGRKFDMKFGPWEIMFLVSRAARDLKKRAEGEQLGLQGLRRNGQLMTAPLMTAHGGKIVELTEEHFPWIGEKKFENCKQVGGHRFPSSWLEGRMQHLDNGVPKNVEWTQVLVMDGSVWGGSSLRVGGGDPHCGSVGDSHSGWLPLVIGRGL